jgi:hypothetical protein
VTAGAGGDEAIGMRGQQRSGEGWLMARRLETNTAGRRARARRQAARRDGQGGGASAPRRPPRGDAMGGRSAERSVQTCLVLVRSRTRGWRRAPCAAAIGWQLDSGVLPATEIAALCVAVRAELAHADRPLRWAVPTALSALFAEYRAVRSTFRRRAGVRRARLPGARRPADCA